MQLTLGWPAKLDNVVAEADKQAQEDRDNFMEELRQERDRFAEELEAWVASFPPFDSIRRGVKRFHRTRAEDEHAQRGTCFAPDASLTTLSDLKAVHY